MKKLKQIGESVSATSYNEGTKELTVILEQKFLTEDEAHTFTVDVRERYFDVPMDAAAALSAASDKTQHLLTHIREQYSSRYFYI